MIVSFAVFGAVIVFLIAAAEVSRRFTSHHVHDSNSRRMMLLGQRVLFWVMLILIVSFALALNLRSLATFLGLLSAGIVVAMQK
jgi:hypothetical protein